ncbi:MAG: YybH family protein [Egibacteraceae bacterium]
MGAHSPKELLGQVSAAFNEVDIDALIALYEPGATLVAQPGQPVTGIEAIRIALQSFLAVKPAFDLEVRSIFEAQGLALVNSNWTLEGTAPDGSTGDER